MAVGLFDSAEKDATPLMGQYFAVKRKYQDGLLLFRLGDFFELFFDDAKKAASILNIALTHRGKHKDEDIPMCGIPAAAADSYIARLVRSGEKVIVCDQIENPEDAKKRGYKSIIKREVTRILTAGTLIDESLLKAKQNNFLMAIVPTMNKKDGIIRTVSFSAIDISTGDFFVNTVNYDEFASILELYHPKEILISSDVEKISFGRSLQEMENVSVTSLPTSKFNPLMEKERLEKYFKVSTLDSFGITLEPELSVCGAIIEYLQVTQRGNFLSLPVPKKKMLSNYLIIDPNTSKSLEIVSSTHGEYEYSLLGTLDKTQTAFGARMLASRVAMPIIDEELLNARLDCVEFFVKNENLCNIIRDTLNGVADFERAINRIRFNKFSCRDIGDIRSALGTIEQMKTLLKDATLPSEGEYFFEKIADFSELLDVLKKALIDPLPASNRGMIAEGFSKELDELRYVRNNSQDLLLGMQDRYIARTRVPTLRIRNNTAIGWFIEIPMSQKDRMPSEFIHRQTLLNNVRYVTDELMALQSRLDDVLERWNQLETQVYAELVQKISQRGDEILYAIKCLSLLDIYTNFAHIAVERGYVRPTITNETVLEIYDGKHPILSLHEEKFTPNTCDLTKDIRICLLTGPNMAGKSTYLRQNALIVVMAQIGCYVPAKEAKIGIVDRLFSRIGASDDIARGRSTFMVEMIETATILNQATHNSFVILDEVGRGTSTYDGLAIAWAVIEQLHNANKCRVLFATHYRELTALPKILKNLQCKTLKVQEWNGEVVFYHKIVEGTGDKSYGIHVASIAGVPKKVITRAKELLRKFEAENDMDGVYDMDLASQLNFAEFSYDSLREKIKALDLNDISPRQALDILYDLQKEAN